MRCCCCGTCESDLFPTACFSVARCPGLKVYILAPVIAPVQQTLSDKRQTVVWVVKKTWLFACRLRFPSTPEDERQGLQRTQD
ncbi:hypothetical protein PENSPDRAFT_733804, partial [Peniophora sp. CONT]